MIEEYKPAPREYEMIAARLVQIEQGISAIHADRRSRKIAAAVSCDVKAPQYSSSVRCTLKSFPYGKKTLTTHKGEFMLSSGPRNDMAIDIENDPDVLDAALLLIAGWPVLKSRLREALAKNKRPLGERIFDMLESFEP